MAPPLQNWVCCTCLSLNKKPQNTQKHHRLQHNAMITSLSQLNLNSTLTTKPPPQCHSCKIHQCPTCMIEKIIRPYRCLTSLQADRAFRRKLPTVPYRLNPSAADPAPPMATNAVRALVSSTLGSSSASSSSTLTTARPPTITLGAFLRGAARKPLKVPVIRQAGNADTLQRISRAVPYPPRLRYIHRGWS